jgi:hypothetical protein
MKNIGRTVNNDFLVEMNKKEYQEFCRLYVAVTGSSEFSDHFGYDPSRAFEFDFNNTFHVIRAFYLAKFQVSDMQALLNNIKATLEKTK